MFIGLYEMTTTDLSGVLLNSNTMLNVFKSEKLKEQSRWIEIARKLFAYTDFGNHTVRASLIKFCTLTLKISVKFEFFKNMKKM
jgi:hypothetical protein